jgi:phenylacetate-coenzyme A ligase PaaK-like adenylate-forming protein
MTEGLPDLIFDRKDSVSFSDIALRIFKFQADNNPVYRCFISSLGRTVSGIKRIIDIPFLPAEFFKSQKVAIENLSFETVFESSRTTGDIPSRHFVHDLKLYEKSFQTSFRYFYGDPSEYFIAALLPSYSERQNSSLIYMMNGLIKESRNRNSGFYDNNPEDLIRNFQIAKASGQKRLLIGVSFALLDLANNYSPDLSGTIVMETGGMKGRRKEITREELHEILKSKLSVQAIHSEYGMTELLSQAYSMGNGIFNCPPWMKILIRDPQDPLTVTDEQDRAGGINIIDLANIYSCSFIATSDFGRLHEEGSFSISGRFDNSDIRGCNLMSGPA